MQQRLAAGNWKMNGLHESLAMLDTLAEAHAAAKCEILVCPPAPLLATAAAQVASTPISIGAQTCHEAEKGANTGDISAQMVRDAGATHVILGHSERRAAYGESDAVISARAIAARDAGLIPIVCLGESEAERDAGQALQVIASQLVGSVPDGSSGATLVVAYEPIWAIGTGKIPTMEQIAEVHELMRQDLTARFGAEGAAIRLLYGGSVKAGNAAEIFAVPDVDGALVGGASLTAADFSPIIDTLSNA